MDQEPSINNPSPMINMPSPRQQSWGALISIIVIVLMIIVGAFYAWGQRISQNNVQQSAPAVTSTTSEQ